MIILIKKLISQLSSKFIAVLFMIFIISMSIEYSKYQELVYEEVYETQVLVINIYEKQKYDVLKLSSKSFDFFTKVDKNHGIHKRDLLSIAIQSTKIDFIEYLKGFFTNTIYFDILKREKNFKDKIVEKIRINHKDKQISEVFEALFLAIPLSKETRKVFTNYGISHLVALSGFHLAVLSFLIYWIFYFPYSFFHTRYFPFRNKKYDLLLITLFFLFSYLLLTNIVASLLRAFVMLFLGIFLLRSNIKLITFTNLLFAFLIIIAIFPKYIFSLSLWFSMFGVFYIFLFIKYFKDFKYKVIQLLLFNFWIYLAMNPIVHYFFKTTTYEQLYSPFMTIVFTIFYPLELFAHIFDFAIIFDSYLLSFLAYDFYTFEVGISFELFILYVLLSFLSIFNKKAFISLNIFMFVYNIYLFV